MENDSLLSSNYRDEGARKNEDLRLRASRPTGRTRRLYKSNDDEFIPDTGPATTTLTSKSLSCIRSLAIKSKFDPLKFGEM